LTDDATDWAWRHARSRGNARLAVLAVAANTTGPDATARLGVTEAMARLGGVGKGTVVKALADAVEAGDLEIAEPAKGRRAALYRIPGAVNYTAACGPDSRPQTPACGPDSRPQRTPEEPLRSGSQTTNGLWSGSQTTTPEVCGPDSRPQTLWDEDPEKCATRARASSKAFERMNEGVREGRPRGEVAVIPDSARPIVDQITAAGVIVAWTLAPAEWFIVEALAKRSGPDMLATAAVQAAQRARNGVSHARYFLRTWQALPPAPAEGTVPATPTGPGADVIPLDPTAPRKGRAAQSADHLAAALARMEAQQ
jgi:hypothetical protein